MSNNLLLDRPMRRAGATFAVLALLAASCGSDATSTETTTTTTTEAPIVTTTDTPGGVENPDVRSEDAADGGDTTTPSLVPSSDPSLIQPIDPEGPPGVIDPALEPLFTRAAADLAVRLGVDAAAIAVLHAERVVWPDSSRGCPQPGMQYLQVLTDGVWIVLAHEVSQYTYVTEADGTVFLCEAGIKQRPVEGATPGFGDT